MSHSLGVPSILLAPCRFPPSSQFFWMDDKGSNQLLAEIPAGNPKVFNEICSREGPPTPWDIKSCYLLLLLIWMNSLCPRLPFVPHILNNNQSRWYRMCCFKKRDLQNIYLVEQVINDFWLFTIEVGWLFNPQSNLLIF